MKTVIRFLLIWAVFVPLQGVSAQGLEKQNVVTITADQVDGANDIEAAIIQATAEGTRPGTVLLDGSKGPFTFTDADKSLNIFVSDLTLRGVNHAVLESCADGLFFDGFPLRNILVERIAFYCSGGGVVATGSFRYVTLRNNLFQAEGTGIGLGGSSSDWSISGNVVEAGGEGVWIEGARRVTVTNNAISGNIGINLAGSTRCELRKNSLRAAYQGILLRQESWKNEVQGNTIWGVSQAGIALEPGVTGNQILANQVFCARGASCLTLDVTSESVEENNLSENLP
jgi:parallel beta-helix repeat protein